MQMYEYLALPAPRKGSKIKGLKSPAERFAHAVTELLNEVAAEGWEFWRTETLPSDERKGFRGTTVVENHLMIFRRLSADAIAEQLGEREAAPSAPAVAADAPAERQDPVMLQRPNSEQPVYDTRREPMFRTQNSDPDGYR